MNMKALLILLMVGLASAADVKVRLYDTPMIGNSASIFPPWMSSINPLLRTPGTYFPFPLTYFSGFKGAYSGNFVNQPTFLLFKNSNNDAYTGYFLEHGLDSIGKEEFTNPLKEYLSTGDKRALILNPTHFNTVKDLPVKAIILPEKIKASTLLFFKNVDLPWLLLLDNQDFEMYKNHGLTEFAELELTSEGIKVINQ